MATKKYVTIEKPKAVGEYKAGTYQSQYGDQLKSALDTVTNWKYDPMQDANYQALAKVYGARGNIAAKNTLADAASLNGGYGTSYAVSAAQQARNQYNQELASLVPELEANAYNKAQATYSALRDADTTDYSRFRDTESDRQWQYQQAVDAYRQAMADWQWGQNYNYQVDRDAVADEQWQKNYDYQAARDRIADQQWQKNYDYQVSRDKVADSQWAKNYAYQLSRDSVADTQWQKNYDYQVSRDKVADEQWAKEYALSAGKVSGSSGGSKKKKKSKGGGGGGYTSTASNSSTKSTGNSSVTKAEGKFREAKGGINNTAQKDQKKKKGYYSGPQQ